MAKNDNLRKARAKRLRKQIAQLRTKPVSAKPAAKPRIGESPREFIQRKMAELRRPG